jgi:hypothetical protein
MFDELTDAELADRLCEQAAHVHVATCRLLELIGAFDVRRVWEREGCIAAAPWLSWRCGIGLRAAREHLRAARRLVELPLVHERFARGELSYSKVRALCRMATPATEADLVASALGATAAQMENVGQLYRRVKRLTDARGEHDRRYLRWSWDDDGSLTVHGRLAGEEGARFVAVVEALCPPPAQGEADHRRADALASLVDGAEVTAEVVVHADVALLTGDTDEGCCYIEAGSPLAVETVRRLASDGRLRLAADDQEGVTVGVGRATRSIPTSLRRALRARDGGCVFPGCTNRRRVDAHHVRHWARGGPTALSNLVELCRHHHRLVHEGGYQLAFGNAAVTVTDPGGRDLSALPRWVAARGPTIEEQHAGIDINATTAMARYGGDRPDYVHWIDAIISTEELAQARA